MKDRIAFVVQRYGLEVNGGAEYHCRILAEHLSGRYEVDILTSCARDYMPWDNYYNEGYTVINDVNVYRFPVEKVRDGERVSELAAQMSHNKEYIEKEWIEEVGPYCPQLIHYVEVNKGVYKAIIFFGYSYYPTVVGLRLGLKRTILIPTAHDEANIYKEIYFQTFKAARAILYNSEEEKQFLTDVFHTGSKLSRLTCVGIEMPEAGSLRRMPEEYKQYDNYVIYVGRVCHGKNFNQLNQYFIKYKQKYNSDLKLLVIGRINNGEKLIYHDDIVYCGFVSEEDKMALMQNAKFLIMPSEYESLSLVILESMALGRPVLVNGNCAVLKGQCIRSNAGLYYTNYAEFVRAMNYMLNSAEAYEQMTKNGLEFVQNNYSWEFVVRNVSSLIEEIGNS